MEETLEDKRRCTGTSKNPIQQRLSDSQLHDLIREIVRQDGWHSQEMNKRPTTTIRGTIPSCINVPTDSRRSEFLLQHQDEREPRNFSLFSADFIRAFGRLPPQLHPPSFFQSCRSDRGRRLLQNFQIYRCMNYLKIKNNDLRCGHHHFLLSGRCSVNNDSSSLL